jgi:hypothetical protein
VLFVFDPFESLGVMKTCKERSSWDKGLIMQRLVPAFIVGVLVGVVLALVVTGSGRRDLAVGSDEALEQQRAALEHQTTRDLARKSQRPKSDQDVLDLVRKLDD